MSRTGFPAVFLALALLAAALLAPVAASAEEDGIFAEIHTAKGVITARLFHRRAPLTVMNFIQLAEGTRSWTHPNGASMDVPLYRNLVFHRVRDFMVQTGDPVGDGRGGPGYEFEDEFHPDLHHDRPGMLSMANRGPRTNGSQFFITKLAAPWLNGRHSVFGEVVDGRPVLNAVVEGDRLDKVVILRRGEEALGFDVELAHALANARTEELREKAQKTVPEPTAPVDPATVPAAGQPAVSPGSFEFLVIGHKEMKDAARLGLVFHYDRAGALEVAQKLVRLARAQGADFTALRRRFSDMRRETISRNVSDTPMSPAGLKSIFTMKPGQISDPIDLPTGVYIFKRLPQ